MTERLECPVCGAVERPLLEWRAYSTRAGEEHRHLGAYCPSCGRWLKWLRQQKAMLPARGVPEGEATGG
jgi:endogenous inhibitor of DNA gyrase (YacG/DUF329 family)